MTLARIDHHPAGPRVYAFGRYRVHHGSAALACSAALFLRHHPLLAGAALVGCLHDLQDFPWRDSDNHGAAL